MKKTELNAGVVVTNLNVDYSGVSGRKGPSRRRERLAAAVAVAVGAAGFFGSHAARADDYWTLPGQSGDFNTPANWTGNVPSSGVQNAVDGGTDGGNVQHVGGTVVFSASDPSATIFDLRAADDNNDSGTWMVTGSSLTANSWFRLGDGNTNSNGTYIQTGGTFLGHGQIHVGENGTGTLNVSGGTFSVDGTLNGTNFSVGYASGSKGYMYVSGTGVVNDNVANDQAPMQIAATGGATGYLELDAGGTINSGGNEFWDGQGGTGLMNMSGGTLNVGNWLVIGRGGGTGVLNMTGGTINQTGTNHFTMASTSTASNGTVNQTGGLVNPQGATMWIGENGTALYNLSGTGVVNAPYGVSIDQGGGNATFNLNNGGVLIAAYVTRGSTGGTGVLNFNGGTLQASSGANSYFLSNLSSANVLAGGANISLNGQSVTFATPLVTGTAAGVTDGGVIFAGPGQADMLGNSTFSGAAVVTNGATLQFGNGSAAGSFLGTGGINLSNGTLTVGSQAGAGNVVAGPISGSGSINVNSGLLELGSSNNSYTSTITVSGGAGLILGTGGTTGALSPAGSLSIQGGGIFGYNQSGTVTFVGPIVGGGTILEQAGSGTLNIGATNNAQTLIIAQGVINVTDPTGLNSVSLIQANYPGALAVPLSLETQATLNLFNTGSGGVLALTADTNNAFDFSNNGNVRLGAYPAGATVNYTGTVNPGVVLGSGTSSTTVISHTLVLGGGGGTLNYASPIADGGTYNGTTDTLPTAVDINAGPVYLSSTSSTFSGPVYVRPQGTLVLNGSSTAANFGNTSSLQLNGGVIQYSPTGAALDITTMNHAVSGTPIQVLNTGGVTINTSSNSVTFAGPIVGTPANGTTAATAVGNFTKSGTGTLTDSSVVLATQIYARQGALTFTGAGSVATVTSYASLGYLPGDSATVTLDNGATFNASTTDFNIADVGGTSTATIDSAIVNVSSTNGAATNLSTAAFYIGKGSAAAPYAVGVLNVAGGTVNANGNTQVGVYGTGTVMQIGGIVNQFTGFTSVGRNAGAIGFYNISGGTYNSAFNPIIAGESGTGTINVSGTGVINAPGLYLAEGTNNLSAVGTVNLNGGTINLSGGVTFSGNATTAAAASATFVGTMNLNGGVLKATGFVGSTVPGASSTVNFNGGSVVLSGTSARFLSSITNANILAGGLQLNTSGNSTTLYTTLNSGTAVGTPDGGITKSGTGVLTIAGTQAYTGVTNITGGTLRLAGTTAPIQTGLTAWYDAADTSSLITSGNNVTGVMNKGVAGSGLNALATSSTAYAQLTPLGQNGKNILTYTGAAPYQTSANDPISGTAARTEFIVASRATGASNFVVNQGVLANNTAYGISVETGNTFGYTYGNDVTFGLQNANTPVIVDTTLSATGTFLSGDLISPTVSTFPVATSKTIAANTTASPLQIIARTGTTSSGTLDEVLEYNFSMTSTQVSQIENYLEYKWFNVGSASVTSNLLPVTTVVSVTNAGSTFDLGGTNQQVAGLNGTAGTLVLTEAGTLTLSGTAASTYSGNITAGTGGGLTVSVPSFTLGAANTGAINVQTLGTVNISAGSVLAVTPSSNAASRTLIVASSVNVAPTGSLVLGSGDIDINGGTQSLAAVTQLVATGYNLVGGGKWNGVGGITSSSAAADTSHLHALGVIQNNQDGTQLYGAGTTFDGTNPGASDILVKYTYFGDANLDGKVDGSDYSLIDAGYASNGALTGWLNGDFNYDGSIDGSDYALIDNAFNNQGGNLSPDALVATETAQVAGAASPAAVPEPASLGLLAVGAAGLFARRRRRA